MVNRGGKILKGKLFFREAFNGVVVCSLVEPAEQFFLHHNLAAVQRRRLKIAEKPQQINRLLFRLYV